MTKVFKQRCDFTQISNELISNNKISCKAKAVYCYLYSRPEGWEYYITEICKNFKEKIDTIRSAIHELEQLGYVERQRLRRSDGTLGGFDFFIRTTTEKTTLDIPPHGKKSTMVKTNTNNTNKEIILTNINNTNIKEIYKEKFDLFYSEYPLKKSKVQAEKKFNQLMKESKDKENLFDEIMKGLEKYKREIDIKGTAREYIKHPGTWLNNECWQEDYIITKNNLNEFEHEVL